MGSVERHLVKGTPRFADRRRGWQALFDLLGVGAISCVYYFTLLGHRPLVDWDEAIYGDIAREFARGVSHLTPFWNYHPWLERTPLFEWLTALGFSLFGVSDTAARAVSALSGCAAVALCFALTQRLHGRMVAWLAAAMLLTAHAFFFEARFGTTDMLLTLWMTVSLYGVVRVGMFQLEGWYAFWIGLALGIMTKSAGPAPAVLALIVTALLQRWKLDRLGKHFVFGFLILLAITVPWHVYMFVHFGRAFFDDYIGRQLLTRSLRPLEGHTGGPFFYLVHVAKGAFPWSLLLPLAAVRRIRERRLSVVDCYALTVLGFYTLIETKLPWYITPAYPALAIVAAEEAARWMPRRRAFATAAIALVLVLFLPAFLYTDFRKPYARPEILLLEAHRGAPGEILILCSDRYILDMPAPLFYADRKTAQAYVQNKPDVVEGLGKIDPATNDSKFRDPKPLHELAGPQPALILIENELVSTARRQYRFESIASNARFTLGLIRSRA